MFLIFSPCNGNIRLLTNLNAPDLSGTTIKRRMIMWKITIGPFPTKDEAEHWKESKVKRKDWHPAIVEELKEEHPDPKGRPPVQEKR